MPPKKRRYTKRKQDLIGKMVRLPASIDAQIVALAKQEGVSMNVMIIRLIEEALTARHPQEECDVLRRP